MFFFSTGSYMPFYFIASMDACLFFSLGHSFIRTYFNRNKVHVMCGCSCIWFLTAGSIYISLLFILKLQLNLYNDQNRTAIQKHFNKSVVTLRKGLEHKCWTNTSVNSTLGVLHFKRLLCVRNGKQETKYLQSSNSVTPRTYIKLHKWWELA